MKLHMSFRRFSIRALFASLALSLTSSALHAGFLHTVAKITLGSLLWLQVGSGYVINHMDPSTHAGRHTSSALNREGNVVTSYCDVDLGTLKVASCDDGFCANQTINTVDSQINSTRVGDYSSLALNEYDWPTIGYFDIFNSTHHYLRVMSCYDFICLNRTINTLADSLLAAPHLSVKLTKAGHPRVCYYNNGLYLAICHDRVCNDFTTVVVDNTPQAGYYCSMQLKDDVPMMSYIDNVNQFLQFVDCRTLNCTSPFLTTLDTDTSKENSLQLSPLGDVVVSYFHRMKNLKLARCNHTVNYTQCAYKFVHNTTDNVGAFNSLQLRWDGSPAMSYQDSSNGHLMFAFCNYIYCHNVTVLVVDNSSSYVGEFTSLQIRDNIYAIIIYYDGYPNDDLKVAIVPLPTVAPTMVPTLSPVIAPTKAPLRIAAGYGETLPAKYKESSDSGKNFYEKLSSEEQVKFLFCVIFVGLLLFVGFPYAYWRYSKWAASPASYTYTTHNEKEMINRTGSSLNLMID
ncbi:MAG: hypothetical protein AAF335_00130 [Bacteroidota bacterium]